MLGAPVERKLSPGARETYTKIHSESVSKGIAAAGHNPGSEDALVSGAEPERLLLHWRLSC